MATHLPIDVALDAMDAMDNAIGGRLLDLLAIFTDEDERAVIDEEGALAHLETDRFHGFLSGSRGAELGRERRPA